jgi:rRNA-processing protein FCF1
VVEAVSALAAAGTDVVVVTSDRELRRRVGDAGHGRASVVGPGWLTDLLT